MNIGATLLLEPTVLDAGGQPVSAVLTWTSSDPAIADVSGSGVVTAFAAGDVLITATADNGVAGTAAIHVNAGPPPSTSPVRFNEIHYDNANVDSGEAIEVEGPAGTDVTGYRIVLYNGSNGAPYDTQTLSGVLPSSCDGRGVLFVSYPQDGIQNGAPDGMALFDAVGGLIEFRSYEGVFTALSGDATSANSVDIGASQSSAAPGTSLQRTSSGTWQVSGRSFGACNPDTPTGGNAVFISGRTASDVPLPVGFQDQLFARLADGNNQTLPSGIVWTSETPTIASIEQNGVLTALGEGSAILRATADDGTTGTISLPTRVAVASTTAVYDGNAEFGEPADSDDSDDYIVRYPQYTASYNQDRGTPNWVSYNLEATHFGAEDRCDCFTMDPGLPASFPQLTTADYTGAGGFHGYGIDRGHLARSFDRTAGSLDNAFTYLFDNIVPQAADLNQGPWAMFENFLGDEARFNNREVYIVTGVAGNKGTLKNEGRVVIPVSTWKVAVLLPRDQGLESIRDYRDLEVIAVNMPNEPGVRDVDWAAYVTTVDAVEALSGYDLLALLADDIEAAVESNTQPPFAAITGPDSLNEGDTGAFGGAGSVDPNGAIASYEWDFGDGTTASGVAVSHVFTQDGVYLVRLTITDNDGLTDSATLSVTVANVAPVVASIADASVEAGAGFSLSGNFTDPGSDAWTATVDWGDGTSPGQAVLSGRQFSLVHTYAAAGTFNVTVTIADDDSAASTTLTVTVTSDAATPTLAPALALLDELVASGKLPRNYGRLLRTQIELAQDFLDDGKPNSAVILLRSVVNQIDLLVRFRVVTANDVAPLRASLVEVVGPVALKCRHSFRIHRFR